MEKNKNKLHKRSWDIVLTFNKLPEEFVAPIADDFAKTNNLKLIEKRNLAKSYWTFRYDIKK